MLLESMLAALLSVMPADAGDAAAAQTATPPAPAAAKTAPAPPAPPVAAPSGKSMAADVKTLVERMQNFYEKTDDFTAEFEQKYTYKKFKRVQTSKGKVTFKKPGLMRWDYESPSPKTFVLAGEKVYAHDPAAQILTVATIDTSQLSASVTFLFGQGKLADEFSIEKIVCKECTGTLLQLTPLKADPRFKRILLETDPSTAQVLKSTVIDPDGSENAITFKALKTNTGVNEKTAFKLNTPEGTHVQDYTKMAAQPKKGALPPAASADGGAK